MSVRKEYERKEKSNSCVLKISLYTSSGMAVERAKLSETPETPGRRDTPYLHVERVGTSSPTSLFLSGIHGDEWGVIEPLRKLLDEKTAINPACFGPHIRALEACPQALMCHSRTYHNVDLNRQFYPTSLPEHPQAKLLAEAFLAHPEIQTVFSFHEDPEDDRFYFYYQPASEDIYREDERLTEGLRKQLFASVEAMGISLYDGIDDIDLGSLIEHGYYAIPTESFDRTFETWAVRRDLHNHPSINRMFLFEIPGKLPSDTKEKLVRHILDEFIEPFLARSRNDSVVLSEKQAE